MKSLSIVENMLRHDSIVHQITLFGRFFVYQLLAYIHSRDVNYTVVIIHMASVSYWTCYLFMCTMIFNLILNLIVCMLFVRFLVLIYWYALQWILILLIVVSTLWIWMLFYYQINMIWFHVVIRIKCFMTSLWFCTFKVHSAKSLNWYLKFSNLIQNSVQ